MRAAVVDSFTHAPTYGEFTQPEQQDGEVLITVAAAALSNLVKTQAAGRHYSSGNQLPFVPGNDGVGRTPEGQRVYFLGPRTPFGSMAECTVVPQRQTLPLPDAIDDVTAAALGNPGMASWGALIGRAKLQRGETVLVNGATGVSGRQAVQVAKYLGAKRVIATGRDAAALEELRSLGADEVISLEQSADALRDVLHAAFHDGDGTQVVLDYLWGRTAELLLTAMGGHGSDDGEPRIRYVQIGSAAAPVIQMSAAWLRSSGVELIGSGLGSLSSSAILDALRTMYDAYAKGHFKIETEAVPLADVERAWDKMESGCRTVFTL
ncbi:MAG: quinone oxidoreductase family protein [Janthinobacterium lividum]